MLSEKRPRLNGCPKAVQREHNVYARVFELLNLIIDQKLENILLA